MEDETDIILFMFFGLLLGVFVMQVLSRIGDPIPYTVVIFAIGILLSVSNKYKESSIWFDSIEKWSKIDAELMLYIFLPPLIFGEAMRLNWFFVQGAFLQSCLLAGPGVVLSAGFMACASKLIIPYHWSWNLCFVFGAVLSASDTVAVLSILKEAGAAPKLTILIVGESLLNDGTAIVIFSLFFNLLLGKNYSGGDIVLFFFNSCLASPLFGMACGLIIVRWLRSCNRSLKEIDTIIQICITICCAYLVFFIAQNPLEISGALACCGAGVMLAWLAPPLILNHETMHSIWGIIEWIGNTLIFLLAGLIIGTRTIETVNTHDWYLVIVLYVVVMVIRFLVVFILYPLLSTTGQKCNRREAVFLAWGCLRGALAMALALLVEKEKSDDSRDQASRLFFYVGGIATLTLLINGTTCSKLLEKLGLMGEASVEKDIMMTQIRKRLRRKVDKILAEMKTEIDEIDPHLEEIRQSCTLLRESDLDMTGILLTHTSAGPTIHTPEGRPTSSRMQSCDIARSSSADDEDLDHIESLAAQKSIDFEATNGSNKRRNSADAQLLASNSVYKPPSRRTYSHHSARSLKSVGATSSSFHIGTDTRPLSRNEGSYRFRKSVDAREKKWDNRTHSLARLVTKSKCRNSNGALIGELLGYVRTVFLEIVRVNYWHDIEAGKLPRLSHSARFLLYSIDVGLDTASTASFMQDWACIERELDTVPTGIVLLSWVEKLLPAHSFVARWCRRLEQRRETRAVYILSSFIDAHTEAQRKMHAYVGMDIEDDDSTPLPEEVKVKNESIALVEMARRRLNAMSAETVSAIRVKQVSQMLLSRQATLVKGMLQEGLLTTKDAEEFLDEIEEDAAKIEYDRNRMYWAQDTAEGAQINPYIGLFGYDGSNSDLDSESLIDASKLLPSNERSL